jgi:hypothetical protein
VPDAVVEKGFVEKLGLIFAKGRFSEGEASPFWYAEGFTKPRTETPDRSSVLPKIEFCVRIERVVLA